MKVRLSTILAVTAALVSGTALFWTSQTVQKEQTALNTLERQAQSERESMRVLRAEWDYLNRPDRLEAIARKTLGMEQPDVTAITDEAAGLPDVAANELTMERGIQPVAYKQHPQKTKNAASVRSATPPDSNSFREMLDEAKHGKGDTP